MVAGILTQTCVWQVFWARTLNWNICKQRDTKQTADSHRLIVGRRRDRKDRSNFAVGVADGGRYLSAVAWEDPVWKRAVSPALWRVVPSQWEVYSLTLSTGAERNGGTVLR